MMDEVSLEQEIQDKGLNAPRLTPELINSQIIGEDYHVFPGTSTTVCLLTLKNGYTILGYISCVSFDNFDAEIGKKVARDNARNKIWALEEYLLKQRLYEQSQQVGVCPEEQAVS